MQLTPQGALVINVRQPPKVYYAVPEASLDSVVAMLPRLFAFLDGATGTAASTIPTTSRETASKPSTSGATKGLVYPPVQVRYGAMCGKAARARTVTLSWLALLFYMHDTRCYGRWCTAAVPHLISTGAAAGNALSTRLRDLCVCVYD
jgi:hypothetical protein